MKLWWRRFHCMVVGHRWGKWSRLKDLARVYVKGKPQLMIRYKRFCWRCDGMESKRELLKSAGMH